MTRLVDRHGYGCMAYLVVCLWIVLFVAYPAGSNAVAWARWLLLPVLSFCMAVEAAKADHARRRLLGVDR